MTTFATLSGCPPIAVEIDVFYWRIRGIESLGFGRLLHCPMYISVSQIQVCKPMNASFLIKMVMRSSEQDTMVVPKRLRRHHWQQGSTISAWFLATKNLWETSSSFRLRFVW